MNSEAIVPDWSQTDFRYWEQLWISTPRDEWYYRLQRPDVGAAVTKHGAMFLAHVEAIKGVGRVSPNPLVGAVLLDSSQRFLSAGAHLQVGQSHAEVHALRDVAAKGLDGAMLFVTLEPCAHQGRTPSCALMISGTAIAEVFVGTLDPFIKVNGQGVAILKNAGKHVEIMSEWTDISRSLVKVFLRNQVAQEIYVGLKVASTPSGVYAGESSSRLWITGERAREFGHFLRLEYDAIMVGPRTVLLDNPALNVRHPHISGRTPLRVILDARGEVLKSQQPLKIFDSAIGPTCLVNDVSLAHTIDPPAGVRMLRLPVNTDGHFEWSEVTTHLWDLGIRSLLIEGGGGLYRDALKAGIVHEIHWFISSEDKSKGQSWNVPQKLRDDWKKGRGLELGKDKLIEFKL